MVRFDEEDPSGAPVSIPDRDTITRWSRLMSPAASVDCSSSINEPHEYFDPSGSRKKSRQTDSTCEGCLRELPLQRFPVASARFALDQEGTVHRRSYVYLIEQNF
jgi:hypothetical protein